MCVCTCVEKIKHPETEGLQSQVAWVELISPTVSVRRSYVNEGDQLCKLRLQPPKSNSYHLGKTGNLLAESSLLPLLSLAVGKALIAHTGYITLSKIDCTLEMFEVCSRCIGSF